MNIVDINYYLLSYNDMYHYNIIKKIGIYIYMKYQTLPLIHEEVQWRPY